MSRVLVTGATGFVGARIVAQLTKAGHKVVTVGRSMPAENNGISFLKTDLLDANARRAAVAAASADSLVHLAWIAEPGIYWHSPLNLDWVGASLDLVECFRDSGGRRAVVIGTCAEYLWASSRLDELSTPCVPSSLYGTAKDATRRVLSSYALTVGLSFAWARLFYIYGPGEKPGRLVSDALAALMEGRPFPTSKGLQRRDFMHVDDVARAIVALLFSDVTGPVNIASGRAVAVRELLAELASIVGNADCLRFGERQAPHADPEVIEGCVDRLRDEVGFLPRFDLRSGLADTVERRSRERGHADDRTTPS